jgi:hypothetical protein
MRGTSKGKLCAIALLVILSAHGVFAAPRDGSHNWRRIRHFIVAILEQMGGPRP